MVIFIRDSAKSDCPGQQIIEDSSIHGTPIKPIGIFIQIIAMLNPK